MEGAKNCRSASRFLPAIAGEAAKATSARAKTAVRPELVEGLFFSLKKGRGFDRLSPNGLWGEVINPLTAAD
ncbi:MAG TPA: hypothetical protein VF489_05115 [Sphingobium sp.]